MHPHWWYYAKPAAVLVGAIVVGVVTLTVDDGTTHTALTWASLGLLVVSTCWLIVRYLTWATTTFVVTSDRVVFRRGVVAKSGIEIPLEHVSAVYFNQSIFERLVGSGEIVIDPGGHIGQQHFTDIGNPRRVQRAIHVQREEHLADRLERFEAMLARGTLTPEEFQAQKERLLGY